MTAGAGPAGCLGVAHLPKCGGLAVRDALASLEGSYTGPRYHDLQHFGDPQLIAGLPEDKLGELARPEDLRRLAAQHRLVMGHVSVRSLMDAGCRAVAIQVREPRARLLSLYRYWQGEPEEVSRAWGMWGSSVVATAKLPLAGFLSAPAAWPAVDNALWRPVLGSGLPGTAGRARRARTPWLAARRYRAVRPHLSIVEWSTRSDRFVERICQAIGAERVPELTRINTTVVRGEPQSIDAPTMAALEAATRSDTALLRRLMDDGALERRSPAELDAEFTQTAGRLAFEIV